MTYVLYLTGSKLNVNKIDEMEFGVFPIRLKKLIIKTIRVTFLSVFDNLLSFDSKFCFPFFAKIYLNY